MNILITGIHGFVGSNLVLSLKQEHTLYGLDIAIPHTDGVVNTFFWEELESSVSLLSIDVIIHLAGKAHDTKNRSVEQLYFDINTGLTKRVFDFFLKSSASKFIFFSSVKAAADRVIGDILTEDVIPAPIGAYGKSKIEAEKYLQEHAIPNKKVYILRPCMIHGPGNKGNLNLLYNLVKKGIPWPLGNFDNLRSLTSIDNLCYLIKGLLDQDIESGIYHIGDDEPLSTNELITIMCEAMGRKAHIWKLNKRLMNRCAQLGTVLHLPLNTERLHKLTENYVVSNAKIKCALGIKKLPVRAEDGLLETIRSFRKQ